jgi:ABC-type dipeptide/oligopeptide/nickel transport system permease component
MLRFAMNRIFWFVPTILAMAAFTFLIMQATPGSPFDVSDKQRPEDIQRLEALYGLDKPLPEQFVRYIWNAVHLDFGISYHARPQTVNEIIARTFPISLHLGAMATIFAVVVGMTMDRLHVGHDGSPLLQHAELRDGVLVDSPLRRLAPRSWS